MLGCKRCGIEQLKVGQSALLRAFSNAIFESTWDVIDFVYGVDACGTKICCCVLT